MDSDTKKWVQHGWLSQSFVLFSLALGSSQPQAASLETPPPPRVVSAGSVPNETAAARLAQLSTQWLNQFGHAEITLTDSRPESLLHSAQLALLLPWYQQKHFLLFTQCGLLRLEGSNTLNLGVGQRWLSAAPGYWGYNLFYDYRFTNHHQRLGIGLERRIDNVAVALNGYLPLSGEHLVGGKAHTERPARGLDVHLHYLPNTLPYWRLKVMAEHYWGDMVVLVKGKSKKSPTALALGVDYTPSPLLTAGYQLKFGAGNQANHLLQLGLNYHLGVPLAQQLNPEQVAASRHSLAGNGLALVTRNAQVVLQQRPNDEIQLTLSANQQKDQPERSVTLTIQLTTPRPRTEWQLSWEGDLLHHTTVPTITANEAQISFSLPKIPGHYTLQLVARNARGMAVRSNAVTLEVEPSKGAASGKKMPKGKMPPGPKGGTLTGDGAVINNHDADRDSHGTDGDNKVVAGSGMGEPKGDTSTGGGAIDNSGHEKPREGGITAKTRVSSKMTHATTDPLPAQNGRVDRVSGLSQDGDPVAGAEEKKQPTISFVSSDDSRQKKQPDQSTGRKHRGQTVRGGLSSKRDRLTRDENDENLTLPSLLKPRSQGRPSISKIFLNIRDSLTDSLPAQNGRADRVSGLSQDGDPVPGAEEKKQPTISFVSSDDSRQKKQPDQSTGRKHRSQTGRGGLSGKRGRLTRDENDEHLRPRSLPLPKPAVSMLQGIPSVKRDCLNIGDSFGTPGGKDSATLASPPAVDRANSSGDEAAGCPWTREVNGLATSEAHRSDDETPSSTPVGNEGVVASAARQLSISTTDTLDASDPTTLPADSGWIPLTPDVLKNIADEASIAEIRGATNQSSANWEEFRDIFPKDWTEGGTPREILESTKFVGFIYTAHMKVLNLHTAAQNNFPKRHDNIYPCLVAFGGSRLTHSFTRKQVLVAQKLYHVAKSRFEEVQKQEEKIREQQGFFNFIRKRFRYQSEGR